MRTRDRRDDELTEDVERRPAAPAPAPQIARVLDLQRGAGNQHVAALLRSARGPLLQREPVTGQATWDGSRHHPHYEFGFADGSEQRPEFDKWFDKGSMPPEYAGTLTPLAVQQIVNAYQGNGSIIGRLVAGLVGTGTFDAPEVDKLSTKGYTRSGAFDVDTAVTGAAGGAAFAAHFLMLQQNIQVREADLLKNVVESVTAKITPKTPSAKDAPTAGTKVYRPRWEDLLATARGLLAAQLQAEAPVPAKDDVVLQERAIATVGGDLQQLYTDKLVAPGTNRLNKNKKGVGSGTGGAQATYTYVAQNPEKAPSGQPLDFAFGLNHLRSILYVEWKAVSQLQALAKAQAPVAVQQQVVQQLVQQAVGEQIGK